MANIQIEINKDLETMKSSIYKGLTGREILYSVACIIVAFIVVGISYFGFDFPVQTASWIALPCCAPFAVVGFYKSNGMTVGELMEKKRCINRMKKLTYRSQEQEQIDSFLELESMEKSNQEETKQELEDVFQKKFKKQLFILIGVVVVVFFMIAMAIVGKTYLTSAQKGIGHNRTTTETAKETEYEYIQW